MERSSKNKLVAVGIALAAVLLIVFLSFRNSPEFRTNKESSNMSPSEKENLINELNQGVEIEPSYSQVENLVIEDLVVGEGREAVIGSTVSVNYAGFLLDGTKFDSSWDRGVTFEFTLGEGFVIKGWEEGVLGMKEGGLRKLIIPSSLGYGPNQVGPITPNSTLVFVVDLVEVQN